MAHALTPTQFEEWERTTQALLEEQNIAMDIANVRDMNGKSTLHNPYSVRMQSSAYTAYNDVTDEDINYVADDLNSFKSRIVSFVYDPESDFFSEYVNAAKASATIQDLDTTPLTKIGNAKAALTNSGVNAKKMILVLDDYQIVKVEENVRTKGFVMADQNIKRGYEGKLLNMDLYRSSSLIAEASLTPASNFAADATVTINGVTFTFKATPANAGEVDIGASTAASIANLVAAINNADGNAPGAGSATTYFEVSAQNRELLEGVVATDGTTKLDIKTRGYRILSSSINKWGDVTLNALVMEKGAIDFAFKSKVKLYTQPVHKQLGTRYMTHVRYGLKTFAQGAKKVYNLKLLAQSAES